MKAIAKIVLGLIAAFALAWIVHIMYVMGN